MAKEGIQIRVVIDTFSGLPFFSSFLAKRLDFVPVAIVPGSES